MDGDDWHTVEEWVGSVWSGMQLSSHDSEAGEKFLQLERILPGNFTVRPNPRKRPRRESSEIALPSYRSLCDGVSLPPPLARSMSSRRSSSPSRVKAQLATATPKVVFLNESLNPECDAARELLGVLTSDEDATSRSNGRGIQMISNASSRCATELRSEGSWMMDVARPLLDLAIDELPLESWSVQTELANAKYLPRFANGTFSPKFDLVVGLPTEPWKAEYEQAGIDIFDRDLSHVDHPHTGKRILGLGMKVKAYGGNLIEAQVELAAWMAGLVSWGFASRCEPSESAEDASALPPPIVGCTVVGQD